jgi:hypothetical protein
MAGLEPAQFRPIAFQASEALRGRKNAFVREIVRRARELVND